MNATSSSGTADKVERTKDENLWKSLTMLSKLFPGKAIPIYTSTVPALVKEDSFVCTVLHSFSSLMVRYREAVASAANRRTSQRFKLVVCRTNDESNMTVGSSDSLAGYTSASGIAIHKTTIPTFPVNSSGNQTVEYLLEVNWKMSWEEHVSYLTFLANYAITNGSSAPFTRYCLLTTAPKNNIRLIKTPLNKRNLSFFEIFQQIDMSLVGSLPIMITPTGPLLDESNPSAAVADFLTMSDLVYLKQVLESEPYNKLSFSLLEQIIDSKSAMEMRLDHRQLQLLACQLWRLIQHSLWITKEAYSRICADSEVKESQLKDVRYILVVVFEFLGHCIYNSNWVNWLVTEHVSKTLAKRIRKILILDVTDTSKAPVEEKELIESDEASEINDNAPGRGSTSELASNVLSWLRLSYSTLVQVNTTLQYVGHVGGIDVEVLSCADVPKDCTLWKEAIYTAYAFQYDKITAKAKAESAIVKIDEVRRNGIARDRAWLSQTGKKWVFSGAVHCETALASEHLQKTLAATSSTSISKFIGPSKRCCPMCCIIIEAINSELSLHEQEKIPILFRHSEPCTSALPPGLPSSVRRRAIKALSENLCRALDNFVEKERTGAHGSQQSHVLSPQMLPAKLNISEREDEKSILNLKR